MGKVLVKNSPNANLDPKSNLGPNTILDSKKTII